MSLLDTTLSCLASEKEDQKQELDGLQGLQQKIEELIHNINRIEEERKNRLSKTEFQHFLSSNDKLVKVIEVSLKRQTMQMTEESRPKLQKLQRTLAEQRRRLNHLTATRSTFVNSDRKDSFDIYLNLPDLDEPRLEEETKLLDNELEPLQLESFEDFIMQRNQRINKFHKDMSLANRIYKDIASIIRDQTEDVEIVYNNTDRVHTDLKSSNKELYNTGQRSAKFLRLACLLIFATICTVLLILRRL